MNETIQIVQRFSSCLKETKKRLTETLDLVTAGKVPEENQIADIVSYMRSLRELHADLRLLALEATGEKLDDDLSAFSYIEAIKRAEEERATAFKAKIDSLVNTLESFLSIRAHGDDYMAALLPFQEEANEALAQIHMLEDCILPDGLEDACERKRLILEAVRIENFSTQEGEALLNEIGPLYPWKIQQGLMLRKYYIESASSEAAGTPDDLSARLIRLDKDQRFVQEDPEGEIGAIDINDGGHSSTEDVPDNGVLADAEAEEIPEAILTPVECIRITKKASAASFKRELLRSAPESNRIVIPVINVCSCIEEEQIKLLTSYMSGDYSNEEIGECISYLMRKGILTRFEMSDGASVYCLSNYGRSLLGKETIRQLKIQNKQFWLYSIEGGLNTYDDGLSEQFAKMRLRQIDRLIGCYAMTDIEPSPDGRHIGPITGITFEGDMLKIRAFLEGSIEEFVVIGEGEDDPEGAQYVLRVMPSDEESATDDDQNDAANLGARTKLTVELAQSFDDGAEVHVEDYSAGDANDGIQSDNSVLLPTDMGDAVEERKQTESTVESEPPIPEAVRASLVEDERGSSVLTPMSREPIDNPAAETDIVSPRTDHNNSDVMVEPDSPAPEVVAPSELEHTSLAVEGFSIRGPCSTPRVRVMMTSSVLPRICLTTRMRALVLLNTVPLLAHWRFLSLPRYSMDIRFRLTSSCS